VARDRHDVVVPRDRPEPRTVRLGVPVDGIVLAEPAELLVRRPVGVRAEIEEIDRHGPGSGLAAARAGWQSRYEAHPGRALSRPPRAVPRGGGGGARRLGESDDPRASVSDVQDG